MKSKGDDYVRITRLLTDGSVDEGAAAIERAREMLPMPVLLECQGNWHFYRREFQPAIAKFEEAMRADAEYDVARYHYLVGVQKEREGDYVEAFKRYQAAIEIEPQFVDAYVELGGLLVKCEDYCGALTCYTDALNLDRASLKNFANRAHVLQLLCGSDPSRYGDDYRSASCDLERARAQLPPIVEPASW
jgi:tetratricopeptide (TPR) repeat protein